MDSLEGTEGFRSVVLAIFRETNRLGHRCITPGHVLLGLACEPADAVGAVLGRLRLASDRVRLAEEQWVSGAAPKAAYLLPFTAAGKRALDLAVEQARALGSKELRCEHLLLALTGDDAAKGVLLKLGVHPDAVRIAMLKDMETGPPPDDQASC